MLYLFLSDAPLVLLWHISTIYSHYQTHVSPTKIFFTVCFIFCHMHIFNANF